MLPNKNISNLQTICYHCGNDCNNRKINIEEKYFCCAGCKSVFEILNEYDLCNYYSLEQNPGIDQRKEVRKDKFIFLDNPDIKSKLIHYTDGKQTQLTFYLPQIHCSSCLWLLENIPVLDKGIVSAKVNFSRKEIFIIFNEKQTSLRFIAETLTKIGYEPHLSLKEISSKDVNKIDNKWLYKIGLAGFCFGNIMMMSFADYLAFSSPIEKKIATYFSSLTIILAIPVLFYSASEFFISAWNGLKSKFLNIDFPIALALLITFSRSLYEIFSGTGNGYLDSMTGIVFFMLIGRWLQAQTYKTISFDRDYKSFFPIALNVVNNGVIIPTEISLVKEKDVIQIYSNEIIPVDAILSKGNAKIDYSFVTGESLPIQAKIGEIIYAGGRQMDGLLELVVAKEVSQSYLTNLWNNPVFNKKELPKKNTYDTIGKYFTYLVLTLGMGAGIYWYMNGESQLMWNAITTILIVACPCALLLSQSYTQGNILRIFGLHKFYLRSSDVIERMSKINHIVLDKTGTITQSNNTNVRYFGKVFSDELRSSIASLLQQSSHPTSKAVFDFLKDSNLFQIDHFKETEGLGIEGWVNETYIKIGSPKFIGGELFKERKGAKVVVFIDSEIWGEFIIANQYRFGMFDLIKSLKRNFSLSLISGDNDAELNSVKELLGEESEIYFNQNPRQKLEYIKKLQIDQHLNVMMVGDGLNDAGAIKQSDIGIAVADTSNNFTPSSDGVIDGSVLSKLAAFIQFAKTGKKIILFTFALSIIYNIIGLYYAMQGILSPVIAAILMPMSSITIIFISYGLSQLFSKKYLPNK